MGNSYYNAEKRADLKLRNKKKIEEIEMLEEIIRGLIEDPLKNGLTEEQMFLIKYYGLDEQEALQKKFDISNVEQIIYSKSEIQRDQLETDRYNGLIDMYSTMEEFDGKNINKYKDCFHKDIKDLDDYTREFEQDPLIVKKMRNLQMLNKMAHKYEFLFKSILYRKSPQIGIEYTDDNIKRIEYNIEEMFSVIKKDAEKAKQKLAEQFGNKTVSEWKSNKAMKYCIKASRWMFKQKDKYVSEILQDLQNNNGEYIYGILNDAIIFEVPGYGQFSVHMGKNNMTKIEALKQFYNVKDYKGEFLGNVYILSKAEPELLKNVNYEELSEVDKQRYRIASQVRRGKQNLEYKGIRKITNDIIDKKQNIESIEQIISKLKETQRTLKQQINEMEEKINNTILGNQEPTTKIIEDVQNLKRLVILQKEKRKEVKQMIKRYKEDKKTMKYTLKQEKEARDSAIDDLEL